MSDFSLTDLQERAYALLRSNGPITQSDLWKELNVSSRSGSRIAKALAKKGLIDREETIADGRETYRLTVVDGDEDSSEPSETPSVDAVELPLHNTDLSPTQKQAVALVYDRGQVTQSELWKTLGVASRTGTRVARALVDAELITREESMVDGRKTYVLEPAASGASEAGGEGDVEVGGESDGVVPKELSLTAAEEAAFEYIVKTSGVPQNSLRSQIDGDASMIDGVVQSLLAKELVTRSVESYYGRKTYWVEPNDDGGVSTTPA